MRAPRIEPLALLSSLLCLIKNKSLAALHPMKTLRLVFLALFVSVLGSAAKPGSTAKPPNIIVILADDLGCRDLKLYDGWVETPRIERMAKEGMTFTDFHANSSVCSPTRTAFLTGRYQQRTGIVDVIVGDREPDQGIPKKRLRNRPLRQVALRLPRQI